jgi:hypothetical protein
LEARGFANTTEEILRSGSVWEPIQAGEKMTLRLMQYPSVGEGFHVYDGERECEALGFPMDYYERHS